MDEEKISKMLNLAFEVIVQQLVSAVTHQDI